MYSEPESWNVAVAGGELRDTSRWDDHDRISLR
jgi:hypothetical protein